MFSLGLQELELEWLQGRKDQNNPFSSYFTKAAQNYCSFLLRRGDKEKLLCNRCKLELERLQELERLRSCYTTTSP